MILSATRRADLPARYARWFMERVRAGWCLVPNPFNQAQVSRVSLSPRDVSAIVFWTRDPRPLLPHLPELEQRGLPGVFQFTLLEYPASIHPHMPPLAERLEAFARLSDAIGPERVLWRYDPILFAPGAGPDFHRESFARLCRALAGKTRRLTVSLLEPYRKAQRRLEVVGGYRPSPQDVETADLLRFMAATAREHGLEPTACADASGLAELGFSAGACVDAALLRRLFGIQESTAKDAGQRPLCGCAPSRDIGMYDACAAGCAYCYATRDFTLARRNIATHDPCGPSMLSLPARTIERPLLPGLSEE